MTYPGQFLKSDYRNIVHATGGGTQQVSNDLNPGSQVSIPCRHCSKALIPLVVKEGEQVVTCPRCGKQTEVSVSRDGGSLRLRTRPK